MYLPPQTLKPGHGPVPTQPMNYFSSRKRGITT